MIFQKTESGLTLEPKSRSKLTNYGNSRSGVRLQGNFVGQRQLIDLRNSCLTFLVRNKKYFTGEYFVMTCRKFK